jgi:hypothetical protein
MRRILWLCILVSLIFVDPAFAKNTEAAESFLAINSDSQTGKIMLDVEQLTEPFLLIPTLEQAIGSNDIGLDRAQNAEPMLVQFQRHGKRLLLVQRNTRFVADSPDADEAQAATDAFAQAVLWAGELESVGSGRNKEQLLNIASLLTIDWLGVSARLRELEQGDYNIAADRSVALAGDSHSYADNAEFAALLSFTGAGTGEFVRQAAANPAVITIKQRLSFVRLPKAGYQPMPFHPASGGYSIGWLDFAQPIESSLEIRKQVRFRLQKTEPNAARSKVLKPIVFYLDRGAPEPIRSALLEGANWWRAAFESAGFIDAFRAELAPVGMDMADVRYNTITWTHRATRGWSYGAGLVDPRSGEIIKGAVNLGSQRVRQDLLIAEGLLAPYQVGGDPDRLEEAKAMALQRLKQLAAHEVGHALGFSHNFAASRNASEAINGSVMDYPHPEINLDKDGIVQLAGPYATGVGEWDHYMVAHVYGQYPEAEQAAIRQKLQRDIAARGFQYSSDADARAPGDSHASGLLWDVHGDPIEGLTHLRRVRSAALKRFAAGAIPPDRQAGEIERRLVPIYLLHRYQSEAVSRLLGGNQYQYRLVGEGGLGVQAVDGRIQQQALAALLPLIDVNELALPDSIQNILTPPATEFARSREYFESQMAPAFDPLHAAAVSTALVAQQVMQAKRLNRLHWQQTADANTPSVAVIFDAFVAQPWRASSKTNKPTLKLLEKTRNWVLLDMALLILNSGEMHSTVAAIWRNALGNLASSLTNSADPDDKAAAHLIRQYLADPNAVKLRAAPKIPPGAPI